MLHLVRIFQKQFNLMNPFFKNQLAIEFTIVIGMDWLSLQNLKITKTIMIYTGVLTKMKTEFKQPVEYYLIFEDDFLNVNQLLGKLVHIKFEKYQCLSCGKNTPIFRQGFCKSCFLKYLPQAIGLCAQS